MEEFKKLLKKRKKKNRKEKGNLAVRDPSTVDIGAVDWTIIDIKCSITICRRKEAVVFKICYQEMNKKQHVKAWFLTSASR